MEDDALQGLDQVAQWVREYFGHPERYRVMPALQPGDIAAMLPEEAPAQGEPFEAIFADFERIVVSGTTHWNHPRFFGVLCDERCAGRNRRRNVGRNPRRQGDAVAHVARRNGVGRSDDALAWPALGAARALDRDHLRYRFDRRLYRFGRRTRIAWAGDPRARHDRPRLPRLRVYVTSETHSHVEKAAIALGIGQENVVRIATGEAHRMSPGALAAAIDDDVRNGMRPLAVVATVGTTSTTSIDPLPADRGHLQFPRNVWLHVDAAYAGTAAILPEFRAMLDGVELADSLVVNPHKWMFVPMDLSVLFVRDEVDGSPSVLTRA